MSIDLKQNAEELTKGYSAVSKESGNQPRVRLMKHLFLGATWS